METAQKESEPQKLQEIQIGEEFLLFDPSSTKFRSESSMADRELTLILNTKGLSKLRLSAGARSPVGTEKTSFFPFDPQEGYKVTAEDLSMKIRREKLEETLAGPKPKGSRKERLCFLVLSEDISAKQFSEAISKLRLQLYFPTMELEGKGLYPRDPYGSRRKRSAVFLLFYPLDTGELPHSRRDIREGHGVIVPNSPEKLSQIRAKFVFADEDQPKQPAERPVEKQA